METAIQNLIAQWEKKALKLKIMHDEEPSAKLKYGIRCRIVQLKKCISNLQQELKEREWYIQLITNAHST